MDTNATKHPRNNLPVHQKWWQRLFGICPANPRRLKHCTHYEKLGGDSHGTCVPNISSYDYTWQCCWCGKDVG